MILKVTLIYLPLICAYLVRLLLDHGNVKSIIGFHFYHHTPRQSFASRSAFSASISRQPRDVLGWGSDGGSLLRFARLYVRRHHGMFQSFELNSWAAASSLSCYFLRYCATISSYRVVNNRLPFFIWTRKQRVGMSHKNLLINFDNKTWDKLLVWIKSVRNQD